MTVTRYLRLFTILLLLGYLCGWLLFYLCFSHMIYLFIIFNIIIFSSSNSTLLWLQRATKTWFYSLVTTILFLLLLTHNHQQIQEEDKRIGQNLSIRDATSPFDLQNNLLSCFKTAQMCLCDILLLWSNAKECVRLGLYSCLFNCEHVGLCVKVCFGCMDEVNNCI